MANTQSDLPDKPTFREAFAAAKASLAAASEETTEEAGAEAAGEGTETDGEDEGETAEPDEEIGAAEGEETSEEEAEGEEEAASGEESEDEGQLLSDAEFKALQQKHAEDPIALRKDLERAFTQKTQKLAERRRGVERLERYADVLDAYEADPAATVRALARDLGLTSLDEPGAKKEPTAEEQAKATADARAALLEDFRQSLGPELDYLADGLMPAITKLAEKIAGQVVDERTKPLREGTERIVSTAASAETDRVMADFNKVHPDWQQHEEAMTAMMDRFPPPPDRSMTEAEYLDHIYTMVTASALRKDFDKHVETAAAKKAKDAVTKMNKSARAAGRREAATPDEEVEAGPPEGRAPTFREAAAAAKRGERWAFETGASGR